MLADPEKHLADEYDQPTLLGMLCSLHDLIGRLAETVIRYEG